MNTKIFHGTKKDYDNPMPLTVEMAVEQKESGNGVLAGLGTFWTDNYAYAENFTYNEEETEIIGKVIEKEINLRTTKTKTIRGYEANWEIKNFACKVYKKQNNLPKSTKIDDVYEMIFKKVIGSHDKVDQYYFVKTNNVFREILKKEGYEVIILVGDKQTTRFSGKKDDRVFIIL